MSLTQTPQIKRNDIVRQWYLINADGISLGRLASLASGLLMGKGKTTYSPHMDQGDGVVVIYAGKARLTGNKLLQKIDFRASGHVGGATYTPYVKLMQDKPERAVELAVKGMLPKNKLRARFMKRLKVFRDDKGQKVYPGAVLVDYKNPKIRSGGPFVAKT